MKYRSFPVVSLFATLPAWAFDGMMQVPEAGFGSQLEFFSAPSHLVIPEAMSAPIEMGMMSKQPDDMVSFGGFTSQRSLPELQETQQARLTQIFSNFLVEVSRYSNNQQSITLRVPDKTKLSSEGSLEESSEEKAELSDYQVLLYRLIEHFAFHDLSVTFDESQGSFVLSSRLNSATRVRVPSRVDIRDFPEGSLTGFTALQQEGLADLTAAWSCFREQTGILSTFMLACSDGSALVWSNQENGYVYKATAPAPVPPEHPFSLLQFGFAEGWHLSPEYVLLAINGKPVKVSVVGDISFDDEPMDDEGDGNSGNGKQTKEDKADTSDDKEEDGKSKRNKKKKKKGPNKGDDDDPWKNKPSDYGRKEIKARYVPDRKTTSKGVAKAESTDNPPSEKKVKRIQGKLDRVSSEANKLKQNLRTKWLSRYELESRNRQSAIQKLKTLEQQQQDLERDLRVEQRRLKAAQSQLHKTGYKQDQLEKRQETTQQIRREIDSLEKKKAELKAQLKEEEKASSSRANIIRKSLQLVDERLIELTSQLTSPPSKPKHRTRGSKLDSIAFSTKTEQWKDLVSDDLDEDWHDSGAKTEEPDGKLDENTMSYSDFLEHPEDLQLILQQKRQEETPASDSPDGSLDVQPDHEAQSVTSPESEDGDELFEITADVVVTEVTTTEDVVEEEVTESLDQLDITSQEEFPTLGNPKPLTNEWLRRPVITSDQEASKANTKPKIHDRSPVIIPDNN